MLKQYQKPTHGNVRKCANLAPERLSGKSKREISALSVSALSLTTPGNFVPIGMFGDVMIVRDEDYIYAVAPGAESAVQIAALAGRSVVYGLQSRDGENFIISTSSGYLILSRSESEPSGIAHEEVSGEAVGMPYFTTAPGIPCQAVVPSRLLSYAYSGAETVRQTDARNLTSDLVEAYRQIANQCAAAGNFLQPCMVRYRLLDRDGNEIFSSPHILVGSPTACGSHVIEFADTQHKTTSPYTLSGTGTALTLHIPSAATGIFPRMTGRLEVAATPMLQPYQPGAPAHCSRKVNAHTDEFAVLHLPGASFGQYSPGSASAASMLSRMISSEGHERILAVITDPFGRGSGHDFAIRSSGMSIEREISDMRAILDSSITACSPSQAMLRSPHRIDASVVASASGLTLAGGLGVRRFRGCELPVIATESSGADPWQAVVTVIFSDGSRLSMPSEGQCGAPVKLSPVVTYPAPDVASIAIQLAVQGQPLRVISLPMSAEPSHRYSVYVAEDLKSPGWREVDGLLTVPPDIIAPLHLDGSVAVCAQGSLLHVHTVADIGAAVNALQPAARALGAWDFGRVRFLCGGRGGIHALTVNSSRTSVAVNLLHPGAVDHAGAMTQALDGEVAAIASGDLLTVHGSTVTTRISGLGSGCLGWHAPDRALWFVPEGEGETRVLFPEFGYAGYSAETHDIGRILTTARGAVIFGPEGILLPGHPDADTDTPVEWHCIYPGPWKGRLRLTVPIAASYFDGTVSLCHRHLEQDGATMAQFVVCGSIHSPLALSVTVPHCDALMLKITGSASSDFKLRTPTLQPLRN